MGLCSAAVGQLLAVAKINIKDVKWVIITIDIITWCGVGVLSTDLTKDGEEVVEFVVICICCCGDVIQQHDLVFCGNA